MRKNFTYKILEYHLVEGILASGGEIAVRVDQALLQDATGTLAMLEFEALGIDRVKVDLAVQYIDHNLLQTDYRNADDHRFLQTACARYGVHYSPPGNGVSHQVHMERFGIPGMILLGADSHTSGAAGVSMLGIGAGGLDVALAMAGYPYRLPCPKVLGVRLVGELPKWVSAKDVILEMLRRHGVKGGVGKIIEYYGPGVKCLSATDRETIGNMGAELGATSTIFPSDERTRDYLIAQGRGRVWTELGPEEGAGYDEYDEIDLSRLEPLIALPSSPGNVVPVMEAAGTKVDQVIVGSSVNSSFRDLMITASILEGRRIHPETHLHINPGSRQVLENVASAGGLLTFLSAGARVHEPGCQGCIGMGQAPGSGWVSLRTFPRNFPGRSGTKDDRVYLCSPETAAASAVRGMITDPRDLGKEMAYPKIAEPERYIIDDRSIIFPSDKLASTSVIRGPNIKSLPSLDPLPTTLRLEVVLVVGDNISTDTIMPAGNDVLPYRSNIEAISSFVFSPLDPGFPKRCRKVVDAAIVAGDNYGQGSSREHAALAPRYLGVRAKIARSFARIHKANLVNFGILPLTFKDPADYNRLSGGMRLEINNLRERLLRGDREIPISTPAGVITAILDVSDHQRRHLIAGGTLNYIKDELKAAHA